MKIYTRKGDTGQTSILGGGRLSKSDSRIRALGAVDESNAALGTVLALPGVPAPVREFLEEVQAALFAAGAALASIDSSAGAAYFKDQTERIEKRIDRAEEQLAPLRNFILPGGGPAGAQLHWARTVLRRAETSVVEAVGADPGRTALIAWMNRLSDALFVYARLANRLDGRPEVVWHSVLPKKASAEPERGTEPRSSQEG